MEESTQKNIDKVCLISTIFGDTLAVNTQQTEEMGKKAVGT